MKCLCCMSCIYLHVYIYCCVWRVKYVSCDFCDAFVRVCSLDICIYTYVLDHRSYIHHNIVVLYNNVWTNKECARECVFFCFFCMMRLCSYKIFRKHFRYQNKTLFKLTLNKHWCTCIPFKPIGFSLILLEISFCLKSFLSLIM